MGHGAPGGTRTGTARYANIFVLPVAVGCAEHKIDLRQLGAAGLRRHAGPDKRRDICVLSRTALNESAIHLHIHLKRSAGCGQPQQHWAINHDG